jgi:hypothetical protein
MTLVSKTKQLNLGENPYKESIARALDNYKREIHFPIGSRVISIIVRRGRIVEKVYQSPDGNVFSDKIR